MNAGSALAARSQGFVQLSVQDRRASRRFRQIAAPRASTGVNDGEETGLVYPGKAGGITPGNGVDKFLLDSGVKTTRTVKDGEVSVTIKVPDRPHSDGTPLGRTSFPRARGCLHATCWRAVLCVFAAIRTRMLQLLHLSSQAAATDVL